MPVRPVGKKSPGASNCSPPGAFRSSWANTSSDQWGYMAGRDEDRLSDLNEAFRDPSVRAVIAAMGGKGTYRIVDDLDTDALRRDPKPVVGFSDITHLHLACGHDAAWPHSMAPSPKPTTPTPGPRPPSPCAAH
ncbi:LD-carboxypeptidase [Streptomyces sp. NPDC101152]|uniref:LD-carboxypeptidase n=1 Tax=Streptomyces sp. NPDC101152 TaxID=3366116 RepID=UPI00382F108B